MVSPKWNPHPVLLTLVFVGLAAIMTQAAEPQPISIIVDGKAVRSKLQAVERENTVYVPVLEVAKAFDYKPEYLEDAKRITFCKGEVCLSIKVGDGAKDALKVDGGFLAPYKELGKVLGVHRQFNKNARTVTFTTKQQAGT